MNVLVSKVLVHANFQPPNYKKLGKTSFGDLQRQMFFYLFFGSRFCLIQLPVLTKMIQKLINSMIDWL